MALNEAECNQCRLELDKLKALPGELASMPEAQARIGELEAALERECNSGSSSSDYGAGAAVVGLFGLGVLATLLAAIFGSKK